MWSFTKHAYQCTDLDSEALKNYQIATQKHAESKPSQAGGA